MKNLLNPKWILLTHILPTLVLFFLLFNQYSIIKTLLEPHQIQFWALFASTLGVLSLSSLMYALYLILKHKLIPIWFGLASLLVYITFMYLYSYYSGSMVPRSIPRWLVSDDVFLYVGTFLMPIFAHSLLVLVLQLTHTNKSHKAWVNFFMALSIPLLVYLFTQTVLPLWQSVKGEFYLHAMLVSIIVLTLAFLFFLIRGVYILVSNKSKTWAKYQLAWRIPIAIVLPLVGLFINNGVIPMDFFISNAGFFGDFSHPWFYILALINGILICLPNLKNKTYRLFLFFARAATFSYTLYFFLVFLPFLPLSIIAVIAAALGFLLLTPLLLFIIHINQLVADADYLKAYFSPPVMTATVGLAILIIPASVTLTYLKDKRVLNTTLAYLYSPDYTRQYAIDKESLKKTLGIIQSHKAQGNRRNVILTSQTPYLSTYFNWLVMDNLTLSEAKINDIEQIFFAKPKVKSNVSNRVSHQVRISDITTSSTYDATEKAWRSWVNFAITNENTQARFAEYRTVINLPEGCWISDYYLYVGTQKEHGILAEKKSAMWVFAQIQRQNRDPGLLHYLTGNQVAFSVFPFTPNETRKTGIEFLHKEPITLNVDNHQIQLGNNKESHDAHVTAGNTATGEVIYVASTHKKELKVVKRTPYFHFVINTAEDKQKHINAFIQRIDTALNTHKRLKQNAKISFVNTYVKTVLLDKKWQVEYKKHKFDGGFYLDRAIRQILLKAHQEHADTYPVIVVVTDNIEHAVVPQDFKDLTFTFPEGDLFYRLDKHGALVAHSLTHRPLVPAPQTEKTCLFCATVLQYPVSEQQFFYLPNNHLPSIILKTPVFKLSATEIKEKNWQTALLMQGQWRTQLVYPATANNHWLHLVKSSFLSKVMTPLTAYLVVENEAQKAMLKRKQEQVLSGNKALDIDDGAQRMSEPSWLLLAVLCVFIVWRKQRSKVGA